MKAIKALYFLPKEKVEAFVNSYNVYNYDWADKKRMIQELGPDYEAKIKKGVLTWYEVINHLCAIGVVEKMYIPPTLDMSKGFIENQNLTEQRMAKDLGVKEGARVLDVGCGRGRIAHHIATLTGAHVTGINIDRTQLASARDFAKRSGLSDQLTFEYHDLDKIPYRFKDNSLDGSYHVQVISLAKDYKAFCKELYRILKPGAKVVSVEWVRMGGFNEKDPYHQELLRKIKPLVGAIATRTVEDEIAGLTEAGFTIELHEEPSIGGNQSAMIARADKLFTRVTKLVRWLVKYKLAPAHFRALLDRMNQDGDAFVKATALNLVSSSYYIVAKKPERL